MKTELTAEQRAMQPERVPARVAFDAELLSKVNGIIQSIQLERIERNRMEHPQEDDRRPLIVEWISPRQNVEA